MQVTKSIDANQIAKEIIKNLNVYAEGVREEVEKAKKETTREIKKEIVAKSPEKTGDYKKGWAVKKVGDSRIVYNKTDYQLTHLLEYPHPLKDGRKSQGYPHISPAEQKGVKNFLKRVEKAVKP